MTDQIEWKRDQWYELSNGEQVVCVATGVPEGVETNYPITLRGKNGVVHTATNSGVIYPGLHVTGPVEPEVTEWKAVGGSVNSIWLDDIEQARRFSDAAAKSICILRRVRKGNKVVSLEIERG